MAVEIGTRELTIRAAPAPGRVRLSVGGLLRRPEREATVETALARIPNVEQVRASSLTGNVLIVFDPGAWTTSDLVEAAARELRYTVRTADESPAEPLSPTEADARRQRAVRVVWDKVPGRARIAVAGLRSRKDVEASVARVVGAIDGVVEASASALTGNVLVRFDPARWTADRLAATCADALADLDRLASHVRTDVKQRLNGTAAVPGQDWHHQPAETVIDELQVDPDAGLDLAAVASRRATHGLNRMPEPVEPSLLKTVLDQVVNAPTALLLAGAAVSVATGGVFDAALIVGVIVVNAGVGATTERSGQRAIATLRRTTAIRARVRRDGAEDAVDAEELVPGDVIQLLPGDPVPADARVISAHRLQVEESALTGESRPVEKWEQVVSADAPLGDRRSMVFRGTTVVGGRASAVVVETGATTQIGALHLLAAEAEAPPTPMERDLDTIGKGLAIGATAVCGAILGVGILRGFPLRYGLEIAVSLGVAAIPEGLPTLATSVLAFASGRMRKKGTLIRTLGAAEALGSVTVVCADKTGTLTENRMAARELFTASGPVAITGPALSPSGSFELHGKAIDPNLDRAVRSSLWVGALCSDAEVEGLRDGEMILDGSATEGSIVIAAIKGGLDPDTLRAAHPRIDLRDRSDGRRHMITVHRGEHGLLAMLKGAPDEVLTMCSRVDLANGVTALDDELQTKFADHNAQMANRAMRVLALAHRSLPAEYTEDDLVSGYTLSGLIGLVDPVRPAAPAAIKALHRAGIRTVMITGDQALTATAVARELGLSRRGQLNVLEAGDLSALDGEALRGLVRDVNIFARVAPEMKLAVVRAIQANGEVAAMTGDGVNDAPALRAADVGVAMGQRGSELARGLADVVLSTDDFAQMVDAVEEGRLVRANVQRVLHYLLSTNASEIWVVAGAVAFGLPSPLTPLQLLWLNLVTDLAPGLALALEPRDPELMGQPPRDPKEKIVPGPMLRRILAESAAIAGGALGVYAIGISRYGIGPAAQSMAFASLLGSQLLHVGWARAGERPALTGSHGRKNPYLPGAMGLSVALQGAALFFPPLRAALGGAPLALADVGIALAGAALPSIAIELSRFLGRHEPRALPAPADSPAPAVASERTPRGAQSDDARLPSGEAASDSLPVSRHASVAPGGAR
ncbi:MAG TPA: HAD-IC family P-type ATPase [Chloroflexota bacterium]|nr:HAD-IC family P-type ATPase [Chloroflexota bacterium]